MMYEGNPDLYLPHQQDLSRKSQRQSRISPALSPAHPTLGDGNKQAQTSQAFLTSSRVRVGQKIRVLSRVASSEIDGRQ